MLNDTQIKDMMHFILEFYQLAKHAHLRGMAEVAKEAVAYLKKNELTPTDFKNSIESQAGQPIPADDLFYNTLVNSFKEN